MQLAWSSRKDGAGGWLRAAKSGRAVALSGLFDLSFYRLQTGETFASEFHAIQHYLSEGEAAGLNPNPLFDTLWYLSEYPEVSRAGRNPLIDFIEQGVAKQRNPSDRFDTGWYLSQNPDVARVGVNPLAHYLRIGWKEARAPTKSSHRVRVSGLFDLSFYRLQTGETFASEFHAIQHYLSEGAAAGLNPNPLFDTLWYLSEYPEVSRAGRNPLIDFIEQGVAKQRNPSDRFDTGWYLSQNPDAARVGVNPLAHYLRIGWKGRRAASPFASDPEIPRRFQNLLEDLAPQDGEMRCAGLFDIMPVRAFCPSSEIREAAGVEQARRPPDESSTFAFPPRPYVARFEDAGIVAGTRLILPEPHIILSDEIPAHSNIEGWAVRPHDLSINTAGQLRVPIRRRYPSVVERGIHLMHEYAGNYFHMVAEVLPRLVAMEEIGVDADVPLLIQSRLAPNLRSLIDCVNERGRRVVELEERYLFRVRELYYASDVSSVQDVYVRPRNANETVLHAPLIRKVADRVLDVHEPDPDQKPWRRLYVRRGKRYRGLQNERELEELLVTRGFELVMMDELSIGAQVRLFRQASVVIAPTGAAVTNILWCQPGTVVFVLAARHHAMPMEIWTELGAIAGCITSPIYCNRAFTRDDVYSLHDDYFADLHEVDALVGRYSR